MPNQQFSRSDAAKVQHPKESLRNLAVILFCLWVVFLSQFSNNTDFTDDTSRVRVEDVREISSDTDSSPDDDNCLNGCLIDNFFLNITFIDVPAFIIIEVFPRLDLLSQIRPRSPPL